MERARELAVGHAGGSAGVDGSAAGSRSRRRQAVELCARQILEVVPRAMRLLREEMRREAGAGVSVPQFRVLVFLGRTPDASLSAVAHHVGSADATASVMVSRLVERGLVTRTSDPSERRRVMLRLTQRGTTLLERARAHARLRMAERLDALSGEELGAVAGGSPCSTGRSDPAAKGAGREPGCRPDAPGWRRLLATRRDRDLRAHAAVRDAHRRRPADAGDPAWNHLRPARPERRRQEHHPQDADHPAPAQRGLGQGCRPGPRPPAARGAAPDRLRAAAPLGRRGADRVREPDGLRPPVRRARAGNASSASARRWR